MHFSREEATRKNAGARPETIGDFIGIDTVQCHSHAEARAAPAILHEDELALPRLREVGEEAALIIAETTAALFRRYRRPRARRMRGYSNTSCIVTAITSKDKGGACVLLARCVVFNVLVLLIASMRAAISYKGLLAYRSSD